MARAWELQGRSTASQLRLLGRWRGGGFHDFMHATELFRLCYGSRTMARTDYRLHNVKARFSSICGACLGILFWATLVPYSVLPEIELLSNSSFLVTLQLHGEIADRKSWACQAYFSNVSPSALFLNPKIANSTSNDFI